MGRWVFGFWFFACSLQLENQTMFDPTSDPTPNSTEPTQPTTAGAGNRPPNDCSGDHRPVAGDQFPQRSPQVRHVLFGPEAAVRPTISNLHRRGYAEPNDWCKPQPTGQPGEVMTVLIKRVPLN
jgi:hypothetical protein